MKRQIRKQLPVFVAIVCLFAGALAIGGYILSNQRFHLPAWVPVLGTDFYEVKAELSTAQAVIPGQGQTVNIAGVPVGEVGSVSLENGRAVVVMQIEDEFRPIHRDATILLRPRTGLKDMFLSLDPGHRRGRRPPRGGDGPPGQHAAGRQRRRGARRARWRPRTYLRILLNAGGTAFDDDATGASARYEQTAEQDLREVFKRFEPTRDGERLTRLLIERRRNIRRVIHNFQQLSTALARRDDQLASLVDSANANFQAFASEEAALREALREFPPALSQTETTLTKAEGLASELGPALGRLRPFARELAPALQRTQPFLRETTPIVREQIRPFARDVRPTVRDLRRATEDLAVVTPRLNRSFGVLNKFFNTLAHNPAGEAQPFLFWSAWGAHAGATLWSLQDAHGPARRGLVLVGCPSYDSLDQIVIANPQLGVPTQLLNLPPEGEVCPNNLQDEGPP